MAYSLECGRAPERLAEMDILRVVSVCVVMANVVHIKDMSGDGHFEISRREAVNRT